MDTFNAKYGVKIFCASPPPVETVKHDAESVYYDSSGPVNVVEGVRRAKIMNREALVRWSHQDRRDRQALL